MASAEYLSKEVVAAIDAETKALMVSLEAQSKDEDLMAYVLGKRRHLRMNPELSFLEFNTCKMIVEELNSIEGIENIKQGEEHTGLATGIVCSIFGTAKAPPVEEAGAAVAPAPGVILLRADMDALQMEDLIDAPYKSTVPNVAHTCGHDSHISMMLGSAKLLVANRQHFSGEVRIVFQPGEETTGGALPMVKAGVADGIDAALSLHVMSYNDVGTVAVRNGIINASEDEFHVTIVGEGGHASQPHLAVNPVVVACQIVNSLQGFLTRTVDALKQLVLTVSHIRSGSSRAVNVIPKECDFAATLRTFDDEMRADLKIKLEEFIQDLAKSFGCQATVTIRHGYKSGFNDKALTNRIRNCVKAMYGKEALVEIDEPEMGSEDFFYFDVDRTVPVSQFWLGVANEERNIVANNHSPEWDIDEACLPQGVAVMAGAAINFLRRHLSRPSSKGQIKTKMPARQGYMHSRTHH